MNLLSRQSTLSGIIALLVCTMFALEALGQETSDNSISRAFKIYSTSDELTEIKPAEWHVFLVAAQCYDPKMRQVYFAEADVLALRDFFIELGVKEKNIVVMKPTMEVGITGPKDFPEKKKIEKRYKDFLDQLPEKALAFVYLSGHGFNLKSDPKKSYFAPIDFEYTLDTSLSIDELMTQLQNSRAKFKWFCTDCCCNLLDVSRDMSSGDDTQLAELEIYGVPSGVLLARSCSKGEVSYEGVVVRLAKLRGLECPGDKIPTEFQHGLFTKALIDGLNRKNPIADYNHDGQITLSELGQYVVLQVQKDAKNYHDGKQTPVFQSADGEKIDHFALLTRLPVYGADYDVWIDGSKLLAKAKTLAYGNPPKYKEALATIQEARKKIPNAPGIEEEENKIRNLYNKEQSKIFFDDAKKALDKQDYKQALLHIQKAALLDKNEVQYTKLESEIKTKLAQQEAIEAYNRALIYYDDKHYDDALKYIKQARERDPNNNDYKRLERAIADAIHVSTGQPIATNDSTTEQTNQEDDEENNEEPPSSFNQDPTAESNRIGNSTEMSMSFSEKASLYTGRFLLGLAMFVLGFLVLCILIGMTVGVTVLIEEWYDDEARVIYFIMLIILGLIIGFLVWLIGLSHSKYKKLDSEIKSLNNTVGYVRELPTHEYHNQIASFDCLQPVALYP